MAFDMEDINRAATDDPAGFIADCDAKYNERIAHTAEKIIANLSHSPIVLLSGPSGSGKTTTAMKVRDELSRRGVKSYSISMDNYFKTVRPETVPRTEEGEPDLESPLCMDMELLNEHFTDLSEGRRIFVPRYEFARQMRSIEPSQSLRLKDNEVVIFEGIHALNTSITGVHPEAFKLYVSARSNIISDEGEYTFKGTWLRLVRRVTRDHLFRGADPVETMRMWENVRKGEIRNISPYKNQADVQLDTAFGYEACIMQPIAEPLFAHVPEDIPYQEIRLVGPALAKFTPIDLSYLPEDAMLREFVGGGIYEY